MSMTENQIKRAIGSFSTDRNNLRQKGHEIAMMIFDHVREHRNTTLALTLAKEFPKSWAAQLENWFKEVSPIRVVTKNGKTGLTDQYKKLSPKDPACDAFWHRELAESTPFWEISPEPDVKTQEYTLESLKKAFFAQAGAFRKKANGEANGKVKEGEETAILQFANWIEELRIPDFLAKAAPAQEVTNDGTVRPTHIVDNDGNVTKLAEVA